jgi:hypothetical protein
VCEREATFETELKSQESIWYVMCAVGRRARRTETDTVQTQPTRYATIYALTLTASCPSAKPRRIIVGTVDGSNSFSNLVTAASAAVGAAVGGGGLVDFVIALLLRLLLHSGAVVMVYFTLTETVFPSSSGDCCGMLSTGILFLEKFKLQLLQQNGDERRVYRNGDARRQR